MEEKTIKISFSFGVLDKPKHDDDLLYHYCSMDSFVNIIKNKCVWFGNLNSMNDPSEMALNNVNIPNQVFKAYQNNPFEFNHEHNGHVNTMKEYLYPSYMEQGIIGNGKYTNSLFAFCLSPQENELSQWRLYGDNGKGVCLGFSKTKIKEFIEKNDNIFMQEVEYSSSLEDVVNKIVENILRKIKTLSDAKDNEKLDEYRLEYVHDVVNEWPKYKVQDYSHEKEVRIIKKVKTSILANTDAIKLTDDDKKIEIRLRNNELITYIPINLEELGLTTISLGPTNNNRKEMINLLLAKSGIDVKAKRIYKSTIPYRN